MIRHNRFRPSPSLHTSRVGGNQRRHLRRGPACERNIAPSMRFVIPRATSSAGVRSTRAYHTQHLPSLGFLNPSTACASADLPVLFHTGATCGIQRTRTIARIASQNDAVDDLRRITPDKPTTLHGSEHAVYETILPKETGQRPRAQIRRPGRHDPNQSSHPDPAKTRPEGHTSTQNPTLTDEKRDTRNTARDLHTNP